MGDGTWIMAASSCSADKHEQTGMSAVGLGRYQYRDLQYLLYNTVTWPSNIHTYIIIISVYMMNCHYQEY